MLGEALGEASPKRRKRDPEHVRSLGWTFGADISGDASLNAVLARLMPDAVWTSVNVFHCGGRSLQLDSRLSPGSLQHRLAVGDFSGEDLWVHDAAGDVRRTDVSDVSLPGMPLTPFRVIRFMWLCLGMATYGWCTCLQFLDG